MRRTIRDHLRSFEKYSGMRTFYVNLRTRQNIPQYILDIPFDLIVYHTWFLATRWDRSLFPVVEKACRPLYGHPAVKIGFPQDEYVNVDHLEQFYNHAIDYVFTVAPLDQIDKIYPNVDRSKVRFHRVLTGYLDDEVVRDADRWYASGKPKTLDVGYRSRPGYPYLGRFGLLKGEIAQRFQAATSGTGLKTDISTDIADTFHGKSWYHFLYRSKYTFGVEGGSHLLDPQGELRETIEAFQKEHPEASFEEIEAACFPGRDGEVKYVALSPRHLEACATRTCQILMEGEYNGILEPNVHYIPLRKDFSNIDECVQAMVNDDRRQEITEAAYQHVVASGQYTYDAFVQGVLATALPDGPDLSKSVPRVQARWLRSQLGNGMFWLLRLLPFLALAKPLEPFYKRYIEPHNRLRRFTQRITRAIFGSHV